MALPDYLDAVVERLCRHLGEDLEAISLVGSAATGAFDPQTSDVDILVAGRERLGAGRADALAHDLSHSRLPCPARKLELVVYTRAELARPRRRPPFELNLNTGENLPDHAGADPEAEPSHWFLIDLDMAREHARPLLGPHARELIGPIPRDWVLDALLESLEWHEREVPGSRNALLNASRAWRFADEGVWSSKPEAEQWALARGEPDVSAAAREAVTRARSPGWAQTGPSYGSTRPRRIA